MNLINKLLVAFAAAAALAAPTMPLAAQDAPSPVVLSGDIKVVKTVTGPDGKERTELVEPSTVLPGDRLIFGNNYANKGAEVVTDIIVTNPLPAAVRLAPDADKALTVSVDGGKTWGVLAALTVTDADGTTRPAAQDDVTHVRWVLASIAPGASGRLTYPAIVR